MIHTCYKLVFLVLNTTNVFGKRQELASCRQISLCFSELRQLKTNAKIFLNENIVLFYLITKPSIHAMHFSNIYLIFCYQICLYTDNYNFKNTVFIVWLNPTACSKKQTGTHFAVCRMTDAACLTCGYFSVKYVRIDFVGYRIAVWRGNISLIYEVWFLLDATATYLVLYTVEA